MGIALMRRFTVSDEQQLEATTCCSSNVDCCVCTSTDHKQKDQGRILTLGGAGRGDMPDRGAEAAVPHGWVRAGLGPWSARGRAGPCPLAPGLVRTT